MIIFWWSLRGLVHWRCELPLLLPELEGMWEFLAKVFKWILCRSEVITLFPFLLRGKCRIFDINEKTPLLIALTVFPQPSLFLALSVQPHWPVRPSNLFCSFRFLLKAQLLNWFLPRPGGIPITCSHRTFCFSVNIYHRYNYIINFITLMEGHGFTDS